MNNAPPPLLPDGVLEWCHVERQAAVVALADYVAGEVRIFRQVDGGSLIDVTPHETSVLQKRIRNLGLLLVSLDTIAAPLGSQAT